MFINTVKKLDDILNKYESGIVDSSETENLFSMHRKSTQFYLSNKDAIPKHADLVEAAEYILYSTGVLLNTKEIAAILSLYPQARIDLAIYGCDDTLAKDQIHDAVYNFFAGCDAPLYKDNINIDRLIRHLQFQAKAMGYKVQELDGE